MSDKPSIRYADEVVYREMTMVVTPRPAGERAEGDEEDPRIPIAISSEYPVERSDWMTGDSYLEVLGHTPSDVDLSRARMMKGLPFLLEHRGSAIGKVEELAISADGVMRGVAREGKHPSAGWVFADMRSGISTSISVGYRLSTEYEQTKDAQGRIVRRYRGWMPLEVSNVPIPADPTVGAGRSAGAPDSRSPSPTPRKGTQEITMSTDVAAPIGADESHSRALAEATGKLARSSDIVLLCQRAGFADQAYEFINSSLSVVQVGEKLLGLMEQRSQALISESHPSGPDLTPRDVAAFSVVRAINGILTGKRSGFEFEVSDDLAARSPKGPSSENAFFVPWQVQAQGMAGARANELTVATAATGGNLKFVEYQGFLELLRNKIVCLKMGVQYLPGLQGDVTFTKQTAAHTFGWQSTELTNQANSAWTLAQVTMAPKIGQAASIVSRKLLAQAVESVEQLVRNDIATIHAIGIDTAILAGTGASGQPTGISVTGSIGDVAGGTNGLQPTFGNVVELWSDIAALNADQGSLGFLTSPLIAARLMQTQRFTSTDTPIWTPALNGEGQVLGVRAMTSNNVPQNQTKGSSTDCSYIYFGDWSKVVLGEWGSLEIVVDPYTLAPSQVKLASIQMVDVAVLYPQAFSVMKDARP